MSEPSNESQDLNIDVLVQAAVVEIANLEVIRRELKDKQTAFDCQSKRVEFLCQAVEVMEQLDRDAKEIEATMSKTRDSSEPPARGV